LIVVDTNVVAGLVLRAERSDLCERLFEQDRDWAAPLLWRSELRNILATQIRVGAIHLDHAIAAAESALALLLGREFSVDTASVLRLTMESRCTAHDCEFVALARHLAVPLVTVDRQVLRAFPSVAVGIERMLRDGT
jgi:predicted nucleic acid-binding protein